MMLEKMLKKHWKIIGIGAIATTIVSYGCGYSDNDPRRISPNIAAIHEIDESGNRIRIHGYRKDIILEKKSESDTTETAQWQISCLDLSEWQETGFGGAHPYYPMSAQIKEGTPFDTLLVDWKNSNWTHTIEQHIIETYVKPHAAGEKYSPGGYHHFFPSKYKHWVEEKNGR